MSRDSSGNYTLPPGVNPVVVGTPITDTWANPTMSDIATELTNSLDRNGRGGMLVPFKNTDGSITAPGVSFQSEASTGLYRAGTGDLRVTVRGTYVWKWTDTLVTCPVPMAFLAPVTGTTFTAVSFVGALSGIASGNLPLTGGTVSGPLVANSGITFQDGTVQTTSAVAVVDPPMMPWSVVAVNTAVAKTNGYAVRTNSASYTMTLPATPTAGDTIAFKDADGNAAAFPFTIARNGNTIEGIAEDMTVAVNYAKFGLAYLNGSWRIV